MPLLSLAEIRDAVARGRLRPGELAAYMRRERTTIAALAARLDVSRARVRTVRDEGVAGAGFVRDWLEGLTGLDVSFPDAHKESDR